MGKILKVNIEDLVLEAGLYGLLWHMNVDFISKYVSHHSWLFATIKYNYDHNITLHVKHSTLEPQRCNDHSIMSLAMHFSTNASDLRSINRVRMQLNIIHLSDITTANGIGLEKGFLKRSYSPHRNDFLWPLKHKVRPQDFTIWRRFL